MATEIGLVNAWLYLNEDEPIVDGKHVGYDDPRSSYQALITEDVYQAVDFLCLAFFPVVATGTDTIPVGGGSTFTLGRGTNVSHPGGYTNEDYVEFVVRDGRRNNPDIKLLATLLWGEGDTISKIFVGQDPRQDAENFATNLVNFLEHFGLDGFDVDWESPISDQTTVQQFQLLFDAIGSAFGNQTTKYYLTLSPAEVGHLDSSTVNDNFDFVNLQLYSGIDRQVFIDAGVQADLLAYGAKFESEYQSALDAYDAATAGEYTIITQWRLNSNNFAYEQKQQKLLHQLAKS